MLSVELIDVICLCWSFSLNSSMSGYICCILFLDFWKKNLILLHEITLIWFCFLKKRVSKEASGFPSARREVNCILERGHISKEGAKFPWTYGQAKANFLGKFGPGDNIFCYTRIKKTWNRNVSRNDKAYRDDLMLQSFLLTVEFRFSCFVSETKYTANFANNWRTILPKPVC